jgi:hypothetical protein
MTFPTPHIGHSRHGLFFASWIINPRGGLVPKNLRGNMFYKGHRDMAEKATQHFKKASIPLKIYLKTLAILEKASISLKKSSKVIKIFIKAPHF